MQRLAKDTKGSFVLGFPGPPRRPIYPTGEKARAPQGRQSQTSHTLAEGMTGKHTPGASVQQRSREPQGQLRPPLPGTAIAQFVHNIRPHKGRNQEGWERWQGQKAYCVNHTTTHEAGLSRIRPAGHGGQYCLLRHTEVFHITCCPWVMPGM